MSDMAKQLDDVHGRASSQAATIKGLAAENRRLHAMCEGLIRAIEGEGYYVYAEELRRELAGGAA